MNAKELIDRVVEGESPFGLSEASSMDDVNKKLTDIRKDLAYLKTNNRGDHEAMRILSALDTHVVSALSLSTQFYT